MRDLSSFTRVQTHAPALWWKCGVLTTGPPGKPLAITFIYLIFMYLAVPALSCGIKDLILGPGVEPGVPALGAQSLTHWTTREVPRSSFHTCKTKGLNCIL